MTTDQRLFGKTFDQQVDIAGDGIADRDIDPNRMVAASIIFEPMLHGGRGGVRITARDGQHKVLWGFVACHEMLSQNHCPVAVYDTLRGMISAELERHKLPSPSSDDDLAAAKHAIAALEETVAKLKKSIEVKKVSTATTDRAAVIARVMRDANRMIELETSSF